MAALERALKAGKMACANVMEAGGVASLRTTASIAWSKVAKA